MDLAYTDHSENKRVEVYSFPDKDVNIGMLESEYKEEVNRKLNSSMQVNATKIINQNNVKKSLTKEQKKEKKAKTAQDHMDVEVKKLLKQPLKHLAVASPPFALKVIVFMLVLYKFLGLDSVGKEVRNLSTIAIKPDGNIRCWANWFPHFNQNDYLDDEGVVIDIEGCVGRLQTELIIEIQKPNLTPSLVNMAVIQSITSSIDYEKEIEEKIAKEQYDKWTTQYATDCYQSLRPETFPNDLWPLVQDIDKPRVKMKWESFKKERLKEIVDQVNYIDIDKSTPGRLIESNIMLAQCLAYIDRYGHPDPDNPPKIVGHECAIELINQNIKPVRVKPRPLNPLESASMSQRTTYMKAAEKLVNS